MPDGSAPRPEAPALAPAQPCLGRVVEIDERGQARVSFPGLIGPPRVARTIGAVSRMHLEQARTEERAILLGFLDGRRDAPVIMSLASMEPQPQPQPQPQPEPELEPEPALELEVDGECQAEVIEAREQLVLRCGDASITLRADGTIRVIGRDITSWARRRQRIRGGSVAIN